MRSHTKAVAAIAALLLLTFALGATLASATAPVVSIDPAPTASYTSAHVTGTVNPEDEETSYYFQYSIDPETEGWSYGSSHEALQPGAGVTNVSDDLTGLKPATEYEARLVTFSASGEVISAEPNPSFTTAAVGPPSVAIDPVTTFTGTTAHFSGTIDPEAPGGNPQAFDVNWHFECTPTCPGLSGGTIAADSSSHAVEADATEPEPNTSYEVTLVAENAGGPTSAGPESFETETAAPLVRSLAAGNRTDTMAWLGAEINPLNSPTTFYVEYTLKGDTAYANSTSVPASEDADAGSGGAFTPVSQLVSGLSANTAYRFRIVAENDQGEQAVGEDRTFETNDALPAPPAGRGYEMVSPLDKGGTDVDWLGPTQAADSGDAVTYTSIGTFLQTHSGNVYGNQLLSRRGSAGWTTEGTNAPADQVDNIFPTVSYQSAFNSDLTKSVADVWGRNSFPGSIDQDWNVVLRDADGSFDALSRPDHTVPPVFGVHSTNTAFGAASRDFSHLVFLSSRPLLSEVPDGFSGIYEYVGGQVRLVNRLPDETLSSTNANPLLGGGERLALRSHLGDHAVSDDGSRIFFGETPPAGARHVYVRQNGSQTIQINASELSTPAGEDRDATFQLASADGRFAFFTSPQPLTDDAPPAGGLYRWDANAPDGEHLTYLTPPLDPTEDSGVEAAFAGADDGSSLYFVAAGDLAPGAERGDCLISVVEEQSHCNLYRWSENEGIRFIAPLESPDTVGNYGDSSVWGNLLDRTVENQQAYRSSRVTPDGRYLLFRSHLRLSSYDTGGFVQIYLYDAAADEVRCVSCNPRATASTGDATFKLLAARGAAYNIPKLPSNLSVDGRRTFFESTEALVAGDTNGKRDVYMWEDGELSLISTGQSGDVSHFVAASPEGDDVFFTTRQPLVGTDVDDLVDLYDARVGGGFPEQRVPPACVGDECQRVPSVLAMPPPIGSAAGAAGNPAISRMPACKRGKKLKNGRCVKKKHRKQTADSNRRAHR